MGNHKYGCIFIKTTLGQSLTQISDVINPKIFETSILVDFFNANALIVMLKRPKYPIRMLLFVSLIAINLTMTISAVFFHRGASCPIIIICVSLYAVILWGNFHGIRLYRKFKSTRQLAQRRFKLIRSIIDIIHTYDFDSDLCVKKLRAIVHIDELRRQSILNLDHDMDKYTKKANGEELPRNDVEFICLAKAGFTPRELCVIYDLANLNSFYVKKHRVMKRAKNLKRKKSIGLKSAMIHGNKKTSTLKKYKRV